MDGEAFGASGGANGTAAAIETCSGGDSGTAPGSSTPAGGLSGITIAGTGFVFSAVVGGDWGIALTLPFLDGGFGFFVFRGIVFVIFLAGVVFLADLEVAEDVLDLLDETFEPRPLFRGLFLLLALSR